MSEFSERKLMYYGMDIKFLNNHCHIFLSIFLVLNLIGIAWDFFVAKTGMTTRLAITIAYTFLIVFSMLSFSLLDKTTFFINLICACFQILYNIITSIISTVVMFSAVFNVNSAVNNVGDVGGAIQSGFGFATGLMTLGTVLALAISLAVAAYYVAVAYSFIKHKKLFFTSLKDLKAIYSAE